MKFNLLLISSLISVGVCAQDQITTPTNTPLSIQSESIVLSGAHIMLNGERFISAKPGGSTLSATMNTFVGRLSGNLNLTGKWNSFFGESAGTAIVDGRENTSLGYRSGQATTSGDYNTFVGSFAGSANTSGATNTFIGREAGMSNETGNNNVSIGYQSGKFNNGSTNIFLGNKAGSTVDNSATAFSNKLYISNRTTDYRPLIYGEFSTATSSSDVTKLTYLGKLALWAKTGIGVETFPTTINSVSLSDFKLFVNGGILTKDLIISNTAWADYVFENSYQLKPLSEVESFILKNKHLPNVPSAKNIEENGINVSEIAKVQQEKIEELTLYLIEQDKLMKKNSQIIETQQKELSEIRTLLKSLALDKK